MDIPRAPGPNETETDRDGHSKEDARPLNPTKEHYGEIVALIEWLGRSFYKGELALPMVTFRTAQKCFAVYVPKKWDHRTGTSRPEFRLNPLLFREAGFDVQCMELLRLMEHLRQSKVARSNYHDRDYAAGMKEHGLQTHREGAPDKETGERITLSVIPGGKFEKLVAKKAESFAFSWAISGEDKGAADTPEKGEPKESKRGVKVEYHCPVEGCETKGLYGRSGHEIACLKHGKPVPLVQSD